MALGEIPRHGLLIGDIVEFMDKGGPRMVVAGTSANRPKTAVICSWFDKNHVFHEAAIPTDFLKKSP